VLTALASFAAAGFLFERYRRPFVLLPLTVF
jgi:hypothetical protein